MSKVKDKLTPTVLGVGFVGEGRFRITINGKITSEYAVWQNMLARCYSSKYHLKNPTYIVSLVSGEEVIDGDAYSAELISFNIAI